jgi:hypothetical protein
MIDYSTMVIDGYEDLVALDIFVYFYVTSMEIEETFERTVDLIIPTMLRVFLRNEINSVQTGDCEVCMTTLVGWGV